MGERERKDPNELQHHRSLIDQVQSFISAPTLIGVAPLRHASLYQQIAITDHNQQYDFL